MSHSRRLCHAPGDAADWPAVVRPVAAGYRVVPARRSPLGSVFAVACLGKPAGELVALETRDGPVWLRVGTGSAPALAAIVGHLSAAYPEVLGGPAGS